jgi:hypothetical protein
MSNPSNLYAEKVFSEHPIALWPLDDSADYISLVSEAQRNMESWQIENGTAEIAQGIIDEPFSTSYVSKVTVDDTSGREFSVTCVSPDIVSFDNLSTELSTINAGAFLYSNTPYISGFDIGYEYYDSVSGAVVQNLKFFSTEIYENWIFVSETFTPVIQSSMLRLVIRARFFEGDDAENYTFLVNGISLGQWSEEFNSSSLGQELVSIPQDIFGESGLYGIPVQSYGLQDFDGYYLVENYALKAKNSGFPMVYGTNNVTTMQGVGSSKPSLILPSLGFLNDSGKYKDYTVEFWIRANSDSIVDKKIFGPIRGADGLYVGGPFISFKVGDNFIKHFVGEWYRPMLVQLRYSSSSISMIINGEQVGEIFIDATEIQMTAATSTINNIIVDNDWMAFWSYQDVSPVEIDAVAIYGYKVPLQVAKRRFVYGQGVEFPENINNSYSGSSIFIDYPFSKYSKNYSYPNIGKWSQGAYDNLRINGNTLAFPEYINASAVFNNKTQDEWLEDLQLMQNEDSSVISLRPNSYWNNTEGYIYVNNFSLSSSKAKAFYVTCKEVLAVPAQAKQTVLLIEDNVFGSYFEIAISQDKIEYILKDGEGITVVESKDRYFLGEDFAIGIDIQRFSDYYGEKVAQFFGKLSNMSLYIGGRKDFTQTFTGNIYSVGVCSEKNLSEIQSIFSDSGLLFTDEFVDGNILSPVADAEFYNTAVYEFLYDGGTLGQYANSIIFSHVASYNLSLVDSELSGFKLSVGSNSYWQDYIPLSTFAKLVPDAKGDNRLDLDFLQFNIDYPAPSIFIQEQTTGSWSYEELASEYSNPVQRSYESLDNHLFTGFDSYEDLKNKAENTYKYDTSSSIVKTYVTFQLIEDNPNKNLNYFVNEERPSKDGILRPGDNWLNTKYEVVDNMIIYPPNSVSFEDLAIVTHIEAKTLSIVDTPIAIRRLEYCSLSLSETSATAIGTRFGNDIYPYRKDGFYFTYNQENPFTIYKGSTPYLYMTRNSGITIKGQHDPMVNRGIAVPINQSRSDNHKVIAMQMFLRFDQDFFPYAPTQIFELQSKNSYIKFYMVATHPSGKRAKIYALNSRGQVENGLAFYLNGKLVKDPTITIKEWSTLGIRFANTQDFNNYEGALRINGPLTFNSISYYKSTNLQEVQNVVERPWFKVEKAGALTLDWNYWNAIPYLWEEVLVISTTSYYGVDPSDIYKAYTGTNKIIVDDSIETKFGDYVYKLYNNIIWKTNTYQAV